MIEVVTYDDRGARTVRSRVDDVPDPEHAVFVARTLLDDDRGCLRPRAAFYVAGKLVRGDITRQELAHA